MGNLFTPPRTAINLIESTSEKDLMGSKTAWEVGSDFPPF